MFVDFCIVPIMNFYNNVIKFRDLSDKSNDEKLKTIEILKKKLSVIGSFLWKGMGKSQSDILPSIKRNLFDQNSMITSLEKTIKQEIKNTCNDSKTKFLKEIVSFKLFKKLN